MSSYGAGGLCTVGLRPFMGAGRGSRAAAVYEVIYVIDRVALFDGDVFVAVGDGLGGAVIESDGVCTGGVVIAPIGDVAGRAGDGVPDGVIRFVDDGIALYLGNLAVVADDPVIAAGDTRGAGVDVVDVTGRGETGIQASSK